MEQEEIYNALKRFGIVTDIELKTLELLKQLAPAELWSDSHEKVLLIYLAFLRDGSTRLPLDGELETRWENKFSKIEEARKKEQEDGTYALEEEDSMDSQTIRSYFGDVSRAAKEVKDKGVAEPMVKDDGCLYNRRALDSRNTIMDRFSKIFSAGTGNREPTQGDIDAVTEKYRKESGFNLDSLQAKAICMGRNGSLIITGGPGTGKTTVMAYLLKEIDPEKEKQVYLVAPSGKAADRLKESISESPDGAKLPDNWQSMTIHRLLAYSPITNAFSYNKDNQFDEDTIFVVDECSMIDLNLFAALLEAIPDEAKVYLLGDKDQLPSVDSGAVLGEVLATAPKKMIVELEKSQRFTADSSVGRLALAMQKNDKVSIDELIAEEHWQPFANFHSVIEDNSFKSNLQLFNYSESIDGHRLTRADKQNLLERALKPWVDKFCKADGCEDKEQLKRSKQARILCAEYAGVFGVDNINNTIVKLVHHAPDGELFEGEHVMIVRNITALKLYNGDSGVVAKKGDELFFKKDDELGSKKDDGDTPLRLIPSDCITVAYASTVHKAQGSGYENVLFFLPENEHSLLATRQIAYTGITRVKKGTLYIVGSYSRFMACYDNPTVRDTGIELGKRFPSV